MTTNPTFDFPDTPPLGVKLILGRQEFELIEARPYVRIDGAGSNILVWQTCCPDCGEQFTVTTGRRGAFAQRRCLAHRKPLKRVR
jgi:hypothetical protein